jgi:hypothetical protein
VAVGLAEDATITAMLMLAVAVEHHMFPQHLGLLVVLVKVSLEITTAGLVVGLLILVDLERFILAEIQL